MVRLEVGEICETNQDCNDLEWQGTVYEQLVHATIPTGEKIVTIDEYLDALEAVFADTTPGLALTRDFTGRYALPVLLREVRLMRRKPLHDGSHSDTCLCRPGRMIGEP